jgi:hypothetical protein
MAWYGSGLSSGLRGLLHSFYITSGTGIPRTASEFFIVCPAAATNLNLASLTPGSAFNTGQVL